MNQIEIKIMSAIRTRRVGQNCSLNLNKEKRDFTFCRKKFALFFWVNKKVRYTLWFMVNFKMNDLD